MKPFKKMISHIQVSRALEILLLISILAMLFLIVAITVQNGDQASASAFKMNYRFFKGIHV